MTAAEIQTWIGEHSLRFPAFSTWLDRQNNLNEIVSKAWVPVFARVELTDAIAVSQSMFEASDEPRGFSMHVREVAARARYRRARQHAARCVSSTSGQGVSCLMCHGSGLVYVDQHHDAIAQYPDIGTNKLVMLACPCPQGQTLTTGCKVSAYRHDGGYRYIGPGIRRQHDDSDPFLTPAQYAAFMKSLRAQLDQIARENRVSRIPGLAAANRMVRDALEGSESL